jgi:hypothetical protein
LPGHRSPDGLYVPWSSAGICSARTWACFGPGGGTAAGGFFGPGFFVAAFLVDVVVGDFVVGDFMVAAFVAAFVVAVLVVVLVVALVGAGPVVDFAVGALLGAT